MTRWDAFDDASTPQDRLTRPHRESVRAAGRESRQPGAGVVAPVWAPRVDITEHEGPGVVIELAGRASDQFGRSLSVAQRVVEDAIDTACEGGAPRMEAPGGASYGAAGR